MERKTINQLLKWKNKKNRKPLLMTGVRQCGKTYLIREFGKNEFEETAYFNFDGNTGIQSIFDFDFNGLLMVAKNILTESTSLNISARYRKQRQR